MKHAVLPVDKPEGISSAAVVRHVKKLENVLKAGHMGTLDPFATGLLLLGINKGTKISRFFLNGSKRYSARIHLGVETDTLDKTGAVIREQALPEPMDEQTIRNAVESFKGQAQQIPPAYSALKHKGKPLYRYAREGRTVEKPPRDIEIFDIKVCRIDLPYIDIDVSCSGGTYIRTLAFDIGKELGCTAHLNRLRRTGACGFSISEAVDFKLVEQRDVSGLEKHSTPLVNALEFLPSVTADPHMETKVKHGQRLSLKDGMPEPSHTVSPVRIIDQAGGLCAVVEFDKSSGSFNYCCVFSD